MNDQDAAKGRRGSAVADFCTDRPIKQFNLLTPHQHFRVNFNTTGADAVPLLDADGNGVPDYVDSTAYWLDYAWDVEIGQLGFRAPPPDNRGLGPEIDVYLCALPPRYYGLTQPDADNPLGPNTVSAFLVLDNDYAGYPSSSINGLRVTTAHEFQHVIQFMCYRYDSQQASLYEATAVWMEQQVQPSIPDYLQYVQGFLAEPQKFGMSTHNVQVDVTGYAHVLYLDYLEKHIERDVIRQIWEAFIDESNSFTAIDKALRPHGLNLENSFCELATWCYYTGLRTRGDTFFTAARIFPTMRVAAFREFSGPDLTLGGSLYPLSFGAYRVFLPPGNDGKKDTVDLLVTDARTNFGLGGPTIPMDQFTLEVVADQRSGFTELDYSGGKLYFRLNAPNSQFCVLPLFIGQPPGLFVTTNVSPQPFPSDGAAELLFAVNLAREAVHSARLDIYTSSMAPVREIEVKELEIRNSQLGVVWDGLDSRGAVAPSGIYLYQLTINDAAPVLGKFAVVRR